MSDFAEGQPVFLAKNPEVIGTVTDPSVQRWRPGTYVGLDEYVKVDWSGARLPKLCRPEDLVAVDQDDQDDQDDLEKLDLQGEDE